MNAPIIVLLMFSVFQFQACLAKEVGEHPKAEQSGDKAEPDHVPDELIVVFKEGTGESKMNAINESLNVQVLEKMLAGRIHIIRVPKDKSLEETRKAYLAFPEIQGVDLNYEVGAAKRQ